MAKRIIHSRRVGQHQSLNTRSFPAGSLIFEEGTEGHTAYIILSGLVEITKTGWAGEEVLGYTGQDEIFGEMSLIDSAPRMASARAVKDTECLVIPEEVLRDKLEKADPFIRDLLNILVDGLRSLTEDRILKVDNPKD
ncbi:MAG: cyclic nucleotide-binding domain-containing protein [Acetobacterales bacterium]